MTMARVVLLVAIGGLLPRFISGAEASKPRTEVPGTAAGTESGAAEPFDLEARKQKHPWLWQTPRRQALPAVADRRWPSAAEDWFILKRLEDAGLTPAPDADARLWLRRVHFVITGLPPGLEETRAFLADAKPGARERAVDRLLASPHFGERWARHWMDLMRYAETRGHEGDYVIANAWHYRDYLIRAFNGDVPYDQFLVEHLAGDLLARPRLRAGTNHNESVLGTGWAFLGEENHSPVDIRQDECERLDNKVDVFSKTFLGLTVSCARCHDHKFDPIRARDYYALSGFFLGSSFRQARFESMENNRAMAQELAALRSRFVPRIARAVASSRREELRRLGETLSAAREHLLTAGSPKLSNTGVVAGGNPRLELWVAHLRHAATNSAHPLHLLARAAIESKGTNRIDGRRPESNQRSDRNPAGSTNPAGVRSPGQERVVADYTVVSATPWKVDGEAFGSGPSVIGDIVLGTNPTNPIARVQTWGAARRDLFWQRLRASAGNENDSGRLGATARAGQMLRTPTFTLEAGKVHYLIRGRARVYAAVDSHLMNEGPLHGRLSETFDSGPGDEPRWLTHDLSPYIGHRVHVEFGPDGARDLEVLRVVEAPTPPSGRFLPPPLAASAAAPSFQDMAREFQEAALSANRKLARGRIEADARVAALADWIVRNPALLGGASDREVMRIAAEFLAAQSNLASRVQWESRTAVAWLDGTGVDENILVRGKPFKPGAVAHRSLPEAFPGAAPLVDDRSSGRELLARQLVDPANPLVARVLVNRVWHHVFGRGIVATVDNFGELGERPSHPELLDHLAWQFVHRDGWSMKRLIRRMVLSRTFGMSSRVADAAVEEKDPANVLLHRMPVRRLEGEVIRDALLSVSGRLNPIVGGPPVPVHLTEFLVGRGRPDQSGPLDGNGRRSVYGAMRRNFLPTLMMTFDAPTPFSTVGRRNVTNVPGQSLALMNDPLFHEQARVWAARMLRELGGGGNAADAGNDAEAARRVRWMYETAYARLPEADELRACLDSLPELVRLHEGSKTRELDVWSELGHALFCANEFIYLR